MKKLSIVLVAVLMVAATLVPAAQAAIEVEGDAYVGYYDKYLWRGFNLSSGQPVVQPGVDLGAKGFTLSCWGNYNVETAELNEVDVTIDYSFDVSEMVSLSVGNIFYALDGAKDTNELYLSIALNALLNPSFTAYWDYDEATEDGLFYTASVGHTLELADSLGLNLGALISYNQSSDYAIGTGNDHNDWHNYELSLSADYALTDQLSVSPSVLYSSPISEESKEVIDSEWLAGINVALTF